MHIAVLPVSRFSQKYHNFIIGTHLQLLSDCPCRLRRSCILDANHLDEVGNTAHVIFFVFLARQLVDLDCHSRIRLFLLQDRCFSCLYT